MTSEEDLQFCTRQILRLVMMKNFPSKSQPAIEDLAAALMAAPTRDMAQAVIDHFKSTATAETFCPMESEIKAEINNRQDEFRPNPDCPMCKGSGDIYFPRTNSSKRCDVPGCWARRPAPVYPKGKPFDVSGAVSKVRVQ